MLYPALYRSTARPPRGESLEYRIDTVSAETQLAGSAP
jgi:hypothetical protein